MNRTPQNTAEAITLKSQNCWIAIPPHFVPLAMEVANRAAPLPIDQNDTIDRFQISSHGSAYSRASTESERLNWHHEAMRLCLGGLYPCPDLVNGILAPTEGAKKRVLDLGCGSRIWCFEMAREFPEAEVWGVDRPHVQTIWTEEAPTNCHFETHQTYNFLSEHPSEFDLIHMRFVAGGCEQFLKTLTDIHACLKPGGIFILVDSTGDILAEDGMSVLRMKSKRYPEGSRLRRMFFEVHHANCNLGFDENMMFGILEDGLWEWTDLKDCKAAELLIPIGPWGRDENLEEEKRLISAGRLMQKSLRTVQEGHEFVLRSIGFNETALSKWRRDIDSELKTDASRTSLDVRILWGRRAFENEPSNPDETNNEDSIPTPTASSFGPNDPHWRIFDTPDRWKAMLERRRFLGGGNAEPIMPFVEKRTRRTARRNQL